MRLLAFWTYRWKVYFPLLSSVLEKAIMSERSPIEEARFQREVELHKRIMELESWMGANAGYPSCVIMRVMLEISRCQEELIRHRGRAFMRQVLPRQ